MWIMWNYKTYLNFGEITILLKKKMFQTIQIMYGKMQPVLVSELNSKWEKCRVTEF